jgi:arabinogalactan oligomer / maltooligosaccharide transport system permease protein
VASTLVGPPQVPTDPGGTGSDPSPPPSGGSTTISGILGRILGMGLANALAVFGLFATFGQRLWGMFAFLLVTGIVVNVVYVTRRFVPAKYLLPGMIFLLVFQVYVVAYTGFASLTNYGDGRNLTQEQALERVLALSEVRVPDTSAFPVQIVQDGAELAMLVTPADGEAQLGTTDGLVPLDPEAVEFRDGRAVSVDGYRTLTLSDLIPIQNEVRSLRVPLSDEPDSGSLRTDDGSRAYVARSPLAYDPATDTITDTDTGAVYVDDGFGAYRNADGQALTPGWRVFVGADNYARIVQDARIRGPLIGVTIWTFTFAALSAGGTFIMGLLLALLFNDDRMRGRKIYRSLLVLPYAVPSFLSILVWTGMLNTSFGFINQVLLGGASIPWLSDPWLARFSVLLVNLWLGFPYMFLVCSGALQSIPGETLDAARVDGAGPIQVLRRIITPLLLVSTAPLVIASFAFNFNNFTVVYFITRGGPSIPDAPISVGSTDLLISLVYKLSFGASGNQWGFAAAVSVLIFLIVAVISAIGFRQTRSLEEIN